MNKKLFVTLILMLSMVSVNTSAQSFLKKLGNTIEKEVVSETKKQVNKGIDKLTKKQKKQSQSEQKQVSSTRQQESSNRSSMVQTIDVIVPYGPTTGTTNGHKWVDMGLPSGTRWATCNVGATTAEQPGKYYAWGEIVSKTTYTEGNSKFHDKKATDISGDKVYDVAAAGWGAGWRMPTEKEFAELLHYCDWRYVQKNGRCR